jgi:hypothetical protein
MSTWFEVFFSAILMSEAGRLDSIPPHDLIRAAGGIFLTKVLVILALPGRRSGWTLKKALS